MNERQRFIIFSAAVALLFVVGGLVLGWRLIRGDDSLVRAAAMSAEVISPNADGEDDAARLSYELARNATVSIYLEDSAGTRYYFRHERPRGQGEYEVLFSGVVEGYSLAEDDFEGEVVARLLQDGVYTWTVEATDPAGNTERRQGTITVVDADTTLPALRDFTMDRSIFTPNQDGIDDRVEIQVWLDKEADLYVYLIGPEGERLPIAEKQLGLGPREPGRHYFDYEGGVDNNVTPPPDGTYTVVAFAQDDEGQKVQAEGQLTIELGGVPRAAILPQPVGDTLTFNTASIAMCDTLTFTITVENYGETPMRTIGPWAGEVYDSNWNFNTVGYPTESGAWRLGIGFENALNDYPYRWGLGRPEDLTEIDGHYYLMPGQRAVVTGGIRVVDVFGVRNPQPMWAGLIHEDVAISQVNNRVDPHEIRVEIAAGEVVPECEAREATR